MGVTYSIPFHVHLPVAFGTELMVVVLFFFLLIGFFCYCLYLVVGPSADDYSVQAHTYHGTPSEWVTVWSGLKTAIGEWYTRETPLDWS